MIAFCFNIFLTLKIFSNKIEDIFKKKGEDMKEIIFDSIYQSYDGENMVLEDINLTIEPGERLILLGPSGCGKSTTLRMIAGLDPITRGVLYMNGKKVNDIPPEERNIALVFQNYALFPHMTVYENISYGLKIQKLSKKEIDERVLDALKTLELEGLEDRKPKDLSGGQKQRVALARAIVKRADYLLLDEPLSNLDAQLRFKSRQELVKLHEKYNMTMVYVTHDQTEAMTVGQKIVLLNDGKIQMVGTPSEVYHRPANVFTAKFIGLPSMNIIPADYKDGKLYVEGSRTAYILDERLLRVIKRNDEKKVYIGIRPEKIQVLDYSTPVTLDVNVEYIEDFGGRASIYFKVKDETFNAIVDSTNLKVGELAHLLILAKDTVLFDRESGENIMGDDYFEE